ncbi:MAG: pitrilysin family protein, partial [Planctomycetota bacterium]
MNRLLITIVGLAFVAGCSSTQEMEPPAPKLGGTAANEGTPLPVDPANTYQELDNGFRMVLREHSNPPGKMTIWLHIDTGALNERPSQNGIAHFLEHMAFNGSKNFAPGTLIPRLADLGMQFGADSNAHTTHTETVYKLTMPDTKSETVDLALQIMSDYAYGMLLVEEEIEKERQIILNEKGSRKGAGQRLQEKFMQTVFANSRIAEHTVIGTDQVIQTAPRSEFVDYYNTWYRPEAMTLVAVGEINAKSFADKVAATFSSEQFVARAESRDARGSGVGEFSKPSAFVLSDPELPIAQLRIMRLLDPRDPVATVEEFRHNEVENLGPAILNRRFQDQVQSGTAAYMGAQAGVSSFFDDRIMPSVQGVGLPNRWSELLTQTIGEVDRTIEHGFLESELELVKQAMISAAEASVERASTRNAAGLVQEITAAVANDYPLLSPEQYLELLKQILPTVTVEEVADDFRENFAGDNYSYVFFMPEKGDTLPKADEILSVARDAWEATTEPLIDESSDEPILSELPTPGEVVSQTYDDKFDVTTITLSNGAIVHHREMDYKKESATIVISMPGGTIEENDETRGLSEVANLISATSRLSSSDIRDAMADQKVSTGAGFGMDTYSIQISGSPSDLEAGLQLAYARFVDGKIEDSAFENWKLSAKQALEASKTDPGAQAAEALASTFFGGDIRYSSLSEDRIDALTPAAAEGWRQRVIGRPIEVAVVGDISLEETLPLITRYVGSMPAKKHDLGMLNPHRKIERASGPYEKRIEFESVTPQAMVQAGFRGADASDLDDRRRMNFVMLILQERMTKQLREEEKLVYSIGCFHQPGEGMPGTGVLLAQSPAEPENADKLADRIHEMMKQFAEEGPTEHEVEVAAKQIANVLDNQMKEPSFWLRQLSTLVYRDRDLNNLEGLNEYYQSVTPTEVRDVARKYMTPENAIR